MAPSAAARVSLPSSTATRRPSSDKARPSAARMAPLVKAAAKSSGAKGPGAAKLSPPPQCQAFDQCAGLHGEILRRQTGQCGKAGRYRALRQSANHAPAQKLHRLACAQQRGQIGCRSRCWDRGRNKDRAGPGVARRCLDSGGTRKRQTRRIVDPPAHVTGPAAGVAQQDAVAIGGQPVKLHHQPRQADPRGPARQLGRVGAKRAPQPCRGVADQRDRAPQASRRDQSP